MIEAGQNESARNEFIHTKNAVTIAQDKEDFIVVSEQGQVSAEAVVSERHSRTTPDAVIIFD
jgi:phosphopantetheine adenylyltransferase